MKLLEHISKALDAVGFSSKDRLAIALSGGKDSCALLLGALELYGKKQVLAIHIDHAIGPESKLSSQYCANLCAHLGVEYHSHRLTPEEIEKNREKVGLEGAFRALRYDALETICRREEVTYLATAHHANDALETHLLALVRGSGLTGLGGPREHRNLSAELHLVRPLLRAGGEILDNYLDQQPTERLPEKPVTDSSNWDLSFSRNRIRHEVIPVLLALSGSEDPLHRSLRYLKQDRDALEGFLAERIDRLKIDTSGDRLDLSPINSPEDPAIAAALRLFLSHDSQGHPPSSRLVERLIRALSEPGRTRWIDAPGCRLEVSQFCVTKKPPVARSNGSPPFTVDRDPVLFCLGESAQISDLQVIVSASTLPTPPPRVKASQQHAVFFDLSRLGKVVEQGFSLREARPSDRFHPFGMPEPVRLFRWMSAQKISRSDRHKIPVVLLGKKIIWVVGHRRSKIAPVTEKTASVLQLSAQTSPLNS